MATYSPQALGIKPPAGGFKEGGWYSGRQFIGGTLGEPGVIHPQSTQIGAGQLVSPQVNAASAAAQGITPQQLEAYLEQQRRLTPQATPTPSAVPAATPKTAPETPSGTTLPTPPAIVPPETVNLPEIYKNLYSASGIREKEEELAQKQRDLAEARAKINDNPFLSEATRVGRIAKLESLFNERTANLMSEIATKKADIETQLNLQTKQLDINSQATQQALSRFNTLLGLGAYDSASGEDIANVTRTTGISSEMIRSAIAARTKKTIESQLVTSTNDAGVVTVTIIDKNTGEIIKQTSLGAIGNVQTGARATEAEKKEYYENLVRGQVAKGATLGQLYADFTGYVDPNTILLLYNAGSRYGPATETWTELAKFGVKRPGGG